MRKAILLFVLLTLFGIPYLLAQGGFRITGQILSAEDNLPVIGVSVVEKGTANGRLCQNADTAFFYAQSPDFLKPGLCYYPKFSYL